MRKIHREELKLCFFRFSLFTNKEISIISLFSFFELDFPLFIFPSFVRSWTPIMKEVSTTEGSFFLIKPMKLKFYTNMK